MDYHMTIGAFMKIVETCKLKLMFSKSEEDRKKLIHIIKKNIKNLEKDLEDIENEKRTL